MNELGGLSVVLALVILAAAVLWVILPFAIFGIKGHLTNITFELREGRKTAEAQLEETRQLRGAIERLNDLLSRAVRKPAVPAVPPKV